MPKYEVNNIRNVAFVGHGDTGKTTWTEQILFKTGATSRLGEVDNGTSVCDAEPDEKERKNSIDCAIVYGNWKDNLINIFDAPGYPDFVGEALSALATTDSAFLFINAASGIMINTRKMWDQINQLNIPCAIIINKLDMENIQLSELLDSIKETFGQNCLPVIIPNSTGKDFKSVINLIETTPDKLDDYLPEAKQLREKLVESVIEVDDQVLNKYLDGKEVTSQELASALRQSTIKRKVIPIICVSAKKQIGIEETLDFIIRYLPAPSDLGAKKGVNPAKPQARPADSLSEGEEPVERKISASEPFSAQVFKCLSDPYVGKIAYLRIFSGTLKPETSLANSRTQKLTNITKFSKPFGKELKPADQAIAGDIVAVAKIDDIVISDTFYAPNNPIQYPAIKFPNPMVSLAVEPKTKADEQRLSSALARLSDSDPTFKVMRDRQTVELIISGVSTLHLDILLDRLKRRFDVQLNTKPPKIPYKETIVARAEGQYKHKKQSGGRGQYGEVYLKLEPLAHGDGFKFENEIFGGSIPNQYIPAIEKGIKELLERGVLAGYPIVDIKVIVFDGSYHVVDSSEAAFKIAGSKAFQLTFMNAKPVLTEPVVNIEISVPTKFMGDITGDLISRRGRIIGMDIVAGQQVIKATVPLAEISRYSTELRSLTGGEGHYAIEFSHYDVVPSKIQETIVAQSKGAHKEEPEE